MSEQTPFALKGRNPDVLSCIANLSNDEVFTPPEFANMMLDTLAETWASDNDGADIWTDSKVTFLDPCAKSGIFLREITKRLIKGLEAEIPDLQARVDHILTKQVFGIGITQLTALLARRSLYCSKHATGEHSVARGFKDDDGKVWYAPIEHEWIGNRCKYCGGSRNSLGRGEAAETYAYPFLHCDDVQARMSELFGDNMQFDVVIGNPPYQLSDGGQGASAVPIYNKFVDQAKALRPRYLSMVIPARWFFGGRGLDRFRQSMLQDNHLRKIVDFADSRQCFPSVDVAAGICYFLWNRDEEGDCVVVSHDVHGNQSISTRKLLEPGCDIFIRDNRHIPILKKIVKCETGEVGVALPPGMRFDSQVSGQKPFGLRTYYRGRTEKLSEGDLIVVQSGGRAWAPRSDIKENEHLISKWKVFTSKSSAEHAGQFDKKGMRKVLSLSGVLPPNSVVTETYVLLGTFDSETEAKNCFSYARTKFFRFLVAARASAQDLPKIAYSFVPLQSFDKGWSDSELYEKYGLTEDEVALIDSTIKPMEA